MQKKPPTKPLTFLERRIPKSEKYSHIESKLDTGLTVNKVKVITAKECAQRRDEIFYRLTKTQLYNLYNEYELDERETIGDSLMGSPAGPRIVTYDQESQPHYSKPYLILDVREAREYNTCHLLHAKSYPYTLIRRDQYIPEIYQFRNKEESLIIVYCDDERISRDTAKTLVDRGIDNVFLLEGGLREFVFSYPAFVEGDIPDYSPPPKTPGLTRAKLSSLPDDRRSVVSARSQFSGLGMSPSMRSKRATPRQSALSKHRDDMSIMSTKSDSRGISYINSHVAQGKILD